MHDLLLTALWLGLLGGGVAVCAVLFKLGVPRTHVRDLLHVGAGVWVIGWPWWQGWLVPTAIPVVAVVALVAVPLRKLREAFSDQDERWSGIVLYALAFALFTPLGVTRAPLLAGAALLALALGDGLGGAIGRRFGRTRFRVPWAKTKSVEGTVAVAIGAGAGIAIAGALFEPSIPLAWAIAGAAAAAVAEAIAPRASDNLLVPAAVALVLGFAPGAL